MPVSVEVGDLAVVKRLGKCCNWSELLLICRQSFIRRFTESLIQQNALDSSFLFELSFKKWLETVLFYALSSGIELIQLAVDDFLMVDELVVHVGVIVLPLLHGRYFGVQVVLFPQVAARTHL